MTETLRPFADSLAAPTHEYPRVALRGIIADRFVRISEVTEGRFLQEQVRYGRLDGEVMTMGAAPYPSAEAAWQCLESRYGGPAHVWTNDEWSQIDGWMKGGPWPGDVFEKYART